MAVRRPRTRERFDALLAAAAVRPTALQPCGGVASMPGLGDGD